MKRHLMTVLALCAGMAVLTAVGETYEKGKVYGPIVELGDEARTIDGNDAIIDGGGTARCATLGPNVTLKNFTFRNGKAAVGGGVWGGAIQDCTISGCTATEYGAAVANCKVSATTITGCTLPLSSSGVAIHGGIVADSTLDGVTITGCRVSLGTAAPCFGGIAANSTLTGCTVTGNNFDISGDHYGLLFYGGSLSKSTIQGNTVDSALVNVAAYMKVTPVDCTLDGGDEPVPPGPTPPGPVPPAPVDTTVFAGNANYIGWLTTDGMVVGTIEVKAGKAKKGYSSVKLTINPLVGKKVTVKQSVAVGGYPTVDGLTYSSSVIGGTIAINGVRYETVAQADALTSSDRNVKALAKGLVPSGTWTFSLVDSTGAETCFSATVAAKTGKTKVTALLPNGKKVTFSSSAQFGTDFKILSIPVVYSKKDLSFAFLLQVDVATRIMTLSGFSVPGVRVTGPLALAGVDSGIYDFLCPLDGTRYLTVADGMVSGEKLNISPSGTLMTVLGGKWTVEKSVGSVKAEGGRPYVKYNVGRQNPANLAKLKLKYTAKTGIVSGSFKLYYMDSGKLKNESAVVNGVVVGNELHGAATVKKAGLVLPIGVAPVGN